MICWVGSCCGLYSFVMVFTSRTPGVICTGLSWFAGTRSQHDKVHVEDSRFECHKHVRTDLHAHKQTEWNYLQAHCKYMSTYLIYTKRWEEEN